MAEGILFGVAQSLLTNLGSRALNEVASAWGIKTHVEKLKNTINTIKDVMLDAEEKQVENHTVRGWLDRLRPVMFAADDLFDEFTTMASQRAVMGSDGISEKSFAKSLLDVADNLSRASAVTKQSFSKYNWCRSRSENVAGRYSGNQVPVRSKPPGTVAVVLKIWSYMEPFWDILEHKELSWKYSEHDSKED